MPPPGDPATWGTGFPSRRLVSAWGCRRPRAPQSRSSPLYGFCGSCSNGGCVPFFPWVLMLRWALTPCPMTPVVAVTWTLIAGCSCGKALVLGRGECSSRSRLPWGLRGQAPGKPTTDDGERDSFLGGCDSHVSALQPADRQLVSDPSLHRPCGCCHSRPGACGSLQGSTDASAPLPTAQNLVFPFQCL